MSKPGRYSGRVRPVDGDMKVYEPPCLVVGKRVFPPLGKCRVGCKATSSGPRNDAAHKTRPAFLSSAAVVDYAPCGSHPLST